MSLEFHLNVAWNVLKVMSIEIPQLNVKSLMLEIVLLEETPVSNVFLDMEIGGVAGVELFHAINCLLLLPTLNAAKMMDGIAMLVFWDTSLTLTGVQNKSAALKTAFIVLMTLLILA